MLSQKLRLLVLAAAISLSGCATNVNIREYFPVVSTTPSINYEALYLRGIFNWWEAEPAYLVVSGDDGFYVDVKLIADGQPYDFRFADSNYTSELNCGADTPDTPLAQGKTRDLVCVSGSHNLQFIPSETGTYRFKLLANGNPTLIITRVDI
ncbi:MAG: hypothetical protein P8J70_00785 [Glaciecola sp.]|jgi:hypothetical protein|nr:hypothetical protein [Glaciecola sp.]MDG2098199.1 hypothetical protein [Glaciecola sp.]